MSLCVVRLDPDGLAVGSLALGVLALFLERRPEVEVALCVAGADPESLAVHGLCLGVESQDQQDATKAPVRSDAVGLDADSFAKCFDGLAEAPLLAQELAQVGPRPRVGGIEPHRFAKRGLGGLVASLEVERHAQAAVERGPLGP